MNEESRRILEMLSQGKITVEEADQLLRAVGAPKADTAPGSSEESPRPVPRFLRVAIHKTASEDSRKKEVEVRVPVALIRAGMSLGSIIPRVAGDKVNQRLRAQGIDLDLSKIDSSTIDGLLKDLGELTIDVDGGRSQIHVTCE
jgi:SHOCT-like protein